MKNFFLICFFSYAQFSMGQSLEIPHEIAAPVAVLMNAETGKILFSKNGSLPCHPASVTKIAVAYYVLERIGGALAQKVVASQDALAVVPIHVRRLSGKHPSYRLEVGGTHMGLQVGEEVDYDSLLHGLMLTSGNDAANVLAESVGGTISQFMIELNQFLRSLGCYNTFYKNPHGMPDPEQLTTAVDLAIMSRAALKNPTFARIVSATKYEKAATNKQPAACLMQFNHLLRPGKFFYPYATGVKTGYTIKSGFNLVASAQKGDRKLIAVVLSCDEMAKRYRSAIELFEAAFSEAKISRKLLAKEHERYFQRVEGGKSILEASLVEDVEVSFYPSEEEEFVPRIRWNIPPLPIREGQQVGAMEICTQDGKFVQSAVLFARKAVAPTVLYQCQQWNVRLTTSLKMYRIYAGCVLGVIFLVSSWAFWRKKKKRLR